MRLPNQSAGVQRITFVNLSYITRTGLLDETNNGRIVPAQFDAEFCTNCGSVEPTECLDPITNTYIQGTCVQKCNDPTAGTQYLKCCPPERCERPTPENCCKKVCCEVKVV